MSACTFFGHRECPDATKPKLRNIIEDLIVLQKVTLFYVGNQGHFDVLVRSVLRELAPKYPQIQYAVVLAYLPGKNSPDYDASDTMLPEGIERVHPRYAISWRNNWMLRNSEYVVTYITHDWEGAYRYASQAEKHGKHILSVNDCILPELPVKS